MTHLFLLFVVGAAMQFVTSRAGDVDCAKVVDSQIQCLDQISSPMSISCPTGLDLRINTVGVYRTSSAAIGCPTVHSPADSCLEYSVRSSTFQCFHQPCLVDLLPPPIGDQPASNCFGYSGPLYALATFTCFSIYMNTSAFAMLITDDTIRTLSTVTINSYNPTDSPPATPDVSGSYCSIFVPDGAGQVEISFQKFDSLPSSSPEAAASSSSSNCVELWDGPGTSTSLPSSRVTLCNNTVSPLTLPCAGPTGGVGRFIRVSSTTATHFYFIVTVVVNYRSSLTVQCGRPPYPLIITDMTSLKSADVISTTTTSTTMTPIVCSTNYDTAIIIAVVVGVALLVLSFIMGFLCRLCYVERCRRASSSSTRFSDSDGGKLADLQTQHGRVENLYDDISKVAADLESTGEKDRTSTDSCSSCYSSCSSVQTDLSETPSVTAC